MAAFLCGLLCIMCFFGCKHAQKTAIARPTITPHQTLDIPTNIHRTRIVEYAKAFIGIPYKYGSSNPEEGFDCSGFVSFVLQHFKIKCPRVSYQYANLGEAVPIENSLPGDIILFTGSTGSKIGHMGIITSNTNHKIKFVHSASGKLIGVIESDFEGYYKKHFVKVVRILK